MVLHLVLHLVQFGSVFLLRLVLFALYGAAGVVRFTDEAARDRKKLDTEVEETDEMKTKRLEKAAREETIKEQVQVHDRVIHGTSIALPLESQQDAVYLGDILRCAAKREESYTTKIYIENRRCHGLGVRYQAT